jgi:hypothetical protein
VSHLGTRHSVTVAPPSGVWTFRRSILEPPSGIQVSTSSLRVCIGVFGFSVKRYHEGPGESPKQEPPFSHIRWLSRGGPEPVKAARSAPEGLGLEGEDRRGIVRRRERGPSCSFLAARFAKECAAPTARAWRERRGDQAQRFAPDGASLSLFVIK